MLWLVTVCHEACIYCSIYYENAFQQHVPPQPVTMSLKSLCGCLQHILELGQGIVPFTVRGKKKQARTHWPSEIRKERSVWQWGVKDLTGFF